MKSQMEKAQSSILSFCVTKYIWHLNHFNKPVLTPCSINTPQDLRVWGDFFVFDSEDYYQFIIFLKYTV